MKKLLNQIVALLLITISLLQLTSCDSGTPLQKQIESDIVTSLSEKYESVQLIESEIVKSIKKDETYSAQLNIIANFSLADWSYVASVEYVKYDQGWMLESISMNSETLVATYLPTEDGVVKLLENELSEIEKLDKTETIINKTLLSPEDSSDTFGFDWTTESTWLHAKAHSEYSSIWEYNEQNKMWNISKSTAYVSFDGKSIQRKYYSIEVTKSLDGVWEDEMGMTSVVGTISNFSDSGFSFHWATDIDPAAPLYRPETSHNEGWHTFKKINENYPSIYNLSFLENLAPQGRTNFYTDDDTGYYVTLSFYESSTSLNLFNHEGDYIITVVIK